MSAFYASGSAESGAACGILEGRNPPLSPPLPQKNPELGGFPALTPEKSLKFGGGGRASQDRSFPWVRTLKRPLGGGGGGLGGGVGGTWGYMGSFPWWAMEPDPGFRVQSSGFNLGIRGFRV